MKTPIEKSDSLTKALNGSKTFDEANYYQSKQVEMGGENAIGDEDDEDEFDDDDEVEDNEFYGDDD